MIRRPPRSTQSRSSAASDVYKRQALNDRALDEPASGLAWLALWGAGLFGALSGSLVLDVHDGQPEQLDRRRVVGEMATILDDLAQLIVERLNAVGRVNDLPQRRPECQERGEPLPGALPRADCGGVLLTEVRIGERGQRHQRGVFVRGGVDRAEQRGDGLAVGVGHEPHRAVSY